MAKRSEFLSIWLLLAGFFCLAAVVLVLWRMQAARLPDYVGRVLSAEEQAEVISRNSPLIEYICLTASADFPREAPITKITIHHMADNLTLEALGASFSNADRRASANYAIDSEGHVALYVEEANRAWTSSSRENDSQAVTIEVANDEIGGDWHVSDAAFDTLIELCADICRRNGIQELVFTGDASGSLTLHKFFSDTDCPGPYLESRIPDIVEAVNGSLAGSQN